MMSNVHKKKTYLNEQNKIKINVNKTCKTFSNTCEFHINYINAVVICLYVPKYISKKCWTSEQIAKAVARLKTTLPPDVWVSSVDERELNPHPMS